jgi:hypothetical protein
MGNVLKTMLDASHDAIDDADRQIDDPQKVYADACAHVEAEERAKAGRAVSLRLRHR